MPEVNDTIKRGHHVAKVVWNWLQEQKRTKYVPWVLDESSGHFDPCKFIAQKERDRLLDELEEIILEASEELR